MAYDSWPIGDMVALSDPRGATSPSSEVVDFVAGGLPDGIHNAERLTPEFREGIVAPYADEEGKISLIRNASALNTNHTMALVDRHAEIEAPTLVLWGRHDPWQTITDGERLAEEIPARSSCGGGLALDPAGRPGGVRRGHPALRGRVLALHAERGPGRARPLGVDAVVGATRSNSVRPRSRAAPIGSSGSWNTSPRLLPIPHT